MSSEKEHHGSKDSSFQIVVIPSGDAASTRSLKMTRKRVIGIVILCVLCISLVTTAVILYTPVGDFLPISDVQVAKRYGGQILDVQQKLLTLSQEVLVLREYNRKLRVTLGQEEYSDTLFKDLSSLPLHEQSSSESYEENQSIPEANFSNPQVASIVKAVLAPEFSFQPSFPLQSPVSGIMSREFLPESGHHGIDLAGKIGTVIVAPSPGYVVYTGWTPDDGYLLIMSHGGGYMTVYKHNQTLLKKTGDFAARGDVIALLGNSGKTSYGPHLHFEVWKDGRSRNPKEYIIASTL